MLSELNGQENYFTRICVSGLLNTRKLELAHMLLQDINMFHQHPIRMPDANLDKDRLISSAVANMELNDRRSKIKQPLLLSNTSISSINKISTTTTTGGHEIIQCPIVLGPTTTTTQKSNRAIDEDVELSLNDLTSFSLYASKKPSLIYQPIREHLPTSSTPQVNQINQGSSFKLSSISDIYISKK